MITLAWILWQYQVMMHGLAPGYYPVVNYDEPAKYNPPHVQVQKPGYVKPQR